MCHVFERPAGRSGSPWVVDVCVVSGRASQSDLSSEGKRHGRGPVRGEQFWLELARVMLRMKCICYCSVHMANDVHMPQLVCIWLFFVEPANY